MKPHRVEYMQMRVKVLILALVAAIIALPVPASQFLLGTSAPSTPPSVAAARGHESLGLLLQDPFLIDSLSYSRPASFLDTEAAA